MNGWGDGIALRLPLIDRRRGLGVFFIVLLAMVVAIGLCAPARAHAIDQWLAVDGGDGHTLAIAQDGTLWSWGHNNFGQLGVGDTVDRLTPVQVSGASWTKVSAGGGHSLAIKSDGTLWAWGYNISGQVGNNSTTNVLVPVQIGAFNNWSEISAGGLHSAAIRGGQLWTWGESADGQLGLGTPLADKLVPTQVGALTTWSKVSAGGSHTMAIRTDNTLWASGRGAEGQLGRGNTQTVNTFAQVTGAPTTYLAVSAGGLHTLAVATTGTLWSWGDDSSGQLGNGAATGTAYNHQQIGSATNWTAVSAGNYHSMALNSTGQIWVAGDNSSGQLGSSPPPNTQVTFAAMGTTNIWDKISAGGSHSLAIDQNGFLYGTLWSWGDNTWGQLGNGTTNDNWRPLIVSTAAHNDPPTANDDSATTPEDTAVIVNVRANDVDTEGDAYILPTSILTSPSGSGVAVLNAAGTSYTYTPAANWNGTATFTYTLQDAVWENDALVSITVTPVNDAPVAVDDQSSTDENTARDINVVLNDTDIEGDSLSPTNVSDPAHGTTSVNPNGTIHYTPDTGFKGIDTFTYTANDGGSDSVLPATVAVSVTAPGGSIDQWLAVDGGDGHTVAIAQDGTLWAWGHNNLGQLGDGTTVDSWVPVQISTDRWTKVSAGGGHTLAIKSDGTLWGWGYNVSGQVGNNSTTNVLAPIQIDANTNWTDVSAGGLHSAAISGGTLWTWGESADGQLGLSTPVVDKLVPTQVGALTTWSKVSAGGSHTMAIQTSGTLWATGRGSEGQLGRGNLQSSTTFSQVTGAPTTYLAVSAGRLHTLAVGTNGTLWSWGDDTYGQIGDGAASTGGYPHRQIGVATNWTAVAAGNNHGLALNSANQIWVAGDNSSGQLGIAYPPNTQASFTLMTSATTWDKIATGGDHSFGIDQNGFLWGTLWAWGDDTWGQLGDGLTTDSWHPIEVVTESTNSPPEANDDSAATNEDTAVEIHVRANDVDTDGDAYLDPTSILTSPPGSGVAVISGGGTSYTYTPAANFNGTATFTYSLLDAQWEDTALVTIDVAAVNDAPVANDDSATTAEDTAADIDVVSNDTDVDSNDLSPTNVSDPAHGTATVNVDETIHYVPDADYNGSDSFTYTANDGTVDSAPATVDITVNAANDAPVLDAVGDRTVAEGDDLAFTLSATDADGDPVTFSATGLPAGATLTGADFDWTPGFADAGTYPVTFHASDGDLDDAETITITVTNTNQAPVLDAVGDRTVAEGDDLAFTLSATDADGDPVTFSATGLPAGATLTGADFDWTPGFADAGTYPVTFHASDGDLDDAETITITVTNTNQAPVLDAVGDRTVAEGDDLAFTLSATDADGDPVTFSATGLPAGATLTGADFDWTPGFADAGTYPVTFHASDGDLDDAETITITVTNTNQAPVLDAVGDRTVAEGDDLAFSLSATDADGDPVTFSATGLPAGATLTGADFDWTPGFADAGTYPVTFHASDGDLDDAETITITVTNTNQAPVLDAVGDRTVAEGDDLAFTLSATDADGDPVTFSATGLPAGATLTGADFDWTPGFADAGTYPVTFHASDGDLDDAETITITVTNTNQAPVLDAVGDRTVAEGDDLAFSLSATDADGDPVTFSATGLPAGATLTGADFDWTPGFADAGTYPVTFHASDGDLDDAETITITVTNTNQAPVLDAVGDRTVAEGDDLAFTLSATDADGDPVTFSATGLPAGATLTGADFDWTPGFADAGTYPVTFHASDGDLDDAETITITVTNTNQAPVLDAVGDRTVAEGDDLAFSLSATDADGDPVTFSATGLPAGATLTGADFDWTPGFADAGTYPVTFHASDGDLDDAETITITVTNTNQAPVLDAVGDRTVAEGDDLAFTLSATDADGDPVTFSATGLPAGATLTGADFDWTPGFADAGTYPVTFHASDGDLDDAETITITVTNTNQAPVLDAVGDRTVAEGDDLAFTLSATDADGDPVTFSATGLPAGATLTGADFDWTPGFADAGTYPVTFHASDGDLDDAETITITVTNTNQAPVLDAVGDRTVAEGDDLAFSLSATDADGDPVTFSATGLPAGATLTGADFDWTPGFADAGTYPVTFHASDGDLDDAETITITVTNTNQAPVLDAVGDRTVAEGDDLAFSLSATDADGDPVTFSATGLPAGATLTGADFDWTPGFADAGTYPVTFHASDGDLDDAETITITVTNTNQAPVLDAVGDRTVAEGDDLAFSLSATDADGDPVTFSATGLPAGATLTGADFDWTPGFADAGTYPVTFHASDGDLDDAETITITVTNTNQAPVLDAVGDRTVAEGDDLAFSLSATDADGDPVTFSATGLPAGATLTGADFDWTPGFADAGTYPVTFHASDGDLDDAETITITVTNTNQAPVLDAVGDRTVAEGDDLAFSLSATDADGDPVTFSATGLPAGATLTGADFDWTPGFADAGTYPVTFHASDGDLDDAETITITVTNTNQAPVLDAVGDRTVAEGDDLAFTLSATDADGDPVTFSATGLPAGATLTGADFDWTPGFADAGTYPVTFHASDGDLDDAETITITVTNTNQAPVLDAVGDRTVAEGDDLAFSLSATDADGDPVTFSATGLPAGATLTGADFDWTPGFADAGTYPVTFHASDGDLDDAETITITVTNTNQAPVAVDDGYSVNEDGVLIVSAPGVLANDADADGNSIGAVKVSDPANGAVTLNVDGSFVYTPNGDFSGSDSFTYKANDGADDSNVATVYITVAAVNDAPVAVDDSANTNEDTAVTIDAAANDTDIDSAGLSVTAVGTPDHGSASVVSGKVLYTPPADFSGTAHVSYTVSDGHLTDEGLITITVAAVNDPPVAVNDSANTNEDTAVTIDAAANDTDIDSAGLSVTAVGTPDHGSASVVSGKVLYTPPADFSGTAHVTYTVSDGHLTDEGLITITVAAVNDPPVAVNDSANTNEDTAVTIDAAANDTDIDSAGLSVTAVGTPDHGSASVVSGKVLYTPPADFSGTAHVTYTVSDGHLTDEGLITITVAAVNDPPVAVNDSANTNEDTAVTGNVLTNDSDPEGDSLSAAKATDPSNGSVVVNATGSFTYTPDANFNGSDSFTYTVSDGHGGSAPATVSLTVNSVNDAPSFTKGANQLVLKNAGAQSADDWATDILSGPANESGQAVDFIVTNNNNTLFSSQPAIAPDGTLTFTSASNKTGSATVTVKIHDNGGTANGGVNTSAEQTFTITVSTSTSANHAPVIWGVTVPFNRAKVGTSVLAGGLFYDLDSGDTETGTWNWGDGTTSSATIIGKNVLRLVAGLHSYSTPGVYKVTLTVTDHAGATATMASRDYVVVYDAKWHFWTCRGCYYSPAGSCSGKPTWSGKVSCGFTSKYTDGSTVPGGNFQFQLQSTSFTFSSTSCEWLTVAGNKAQCRGEGTLNGSGTYKFLLTCVQDRANTVRIKIWDKATGAVVYDNERNVSETRNPTTAVDGDLSLTN